jgi:hypothetical protein
MLRNHAASNSPPGEIFEFDLRIKVDIKPKLFQDPSLNWLDRKAARPAACRRVDRKFTGRARLKVFATA